MARSEIDSSNRWRQTVRDRMRSKRLSAKQMGDVSERTVAGWTGSTNCPLPAMGNLRQVAALLDYPLLDQLVDLGQLDALEAQPTLGVSQSVLLAQIARITEAAGLVRPGVREMARALLDSCTDTQHFGRWRTRLFDVPVGDEFKHVGYYGLEALKWKGPDAKREERFSELKVLVEKLIPDEADRSFHATPDIWKRGGPGAWERAEIHWRMRSVAPLVFSNGYGYEGTAHLPLVHRQDATVKRHIFLEPAGPHTAPDPATSARLLRDDPVTGVPQHVDRIAVIAPPMVGGVALARLIGHGLGWECLSINEMVGRHTGRRYRAGHGDERDSYVRRVTDQILTVPPTRPTIYALTALPPLVAGGVIANTVRQLLLDDKVISVIVKPNPETALHWFERQRRQMSHDKRSPAVRANELLGHAEKITDLATSEGRQSAAFELLPVLEWNDVEYFEAPQIGDQRLRAAYEICHLLLHGVAPTSRPRRCNFAEGSALDLYHDRLSRVTRRDRVLTLLGRTDLEGGRS